MAGIFSRYFTQPAPPPPSAMGPQPARGPGADVRPVDYLQQAAAIQGQAAAPAPAAPAAQEPYVIEPLVQPGTRLVPQDWNLMNWLQQQFGVPGSQQPDPQTGYRIEPMIAPNAGIAPSAGVAPIVVPPAAQQAQTAAQQSALQAALFGQGGAPASIPYPPVQQPNGQQMADWLLNYGNSAGTIAAPGASIAPGTQVAPGVTVSAPQLPSMSVEAVTQAGVAGAEAGQNAVAAPGAVKGAEEGAKAGKDAQKNDTPVKPDERGAMFLMRPRGLSGPNAQREDAQELTNYEGLANNAQARRLTWDEYNKLSDDQRRIADLNKLLVRSREDDLDREGSMNEVQKARYYANVASVFGPGGTQSKTVAPRTVDLLASIDYNAVGKDLDDFLSLKEGISVKEQKKGDADMTAANAVRTRAEAAFAEKPDQYWNLNSAVRDNTAENKPGRALPGFKGREPEKDENDRVIWTKDFLYDRMYEGVRNNEPDWDEKNIQALLKSLEFNDDDMRELGQALYLRAQNEKLYQPRTSAVMSDDGKKKQRSPDEILKFLGMGG